MAKDLRYFLDWLRTSGPVDFVEIDRQIPRDLYMTLIQEKLAKERKYPAVMFKNVAGYDWPVVTGLFSSYRLLAHALEVAPTEPGQVLAEFMRREANPIAPVPYSGGTGPVQEVVLTGEGINLADLPIQQHCQGDSGRYITIGCLICRDPVSGATNVGTYRHELKGPNRMGCMMNPVQQSISGEPFSFEWKLEASLNKKDLTVFRQVLENFPVSLLILYRSLHPSGSCLPEDHRSNH